jgi:hypothetical protein
LKWLHHLLETRRLDDTLRWARRENHHDRRG